MASRVSPGAVRRSVDCGSDVNAKPTADHPSTNRAGPRADRSGGRPPSTYPSRAGAGSRLNPRHLAGCNVVCRICAYANLGGLTLCHCRLERAILDRRVETRPGDPNRCELSAGELGLLAARAGVYMKPFTYFVTSGAVHGPRRLLLRPAAASRVESERRRPRFVWVPGVSHRRRLMPHAGPDREFDRLLQECRTDWRLETRLRYLSAAGGILDWRGGTAAASDLSIVGTRQAGSADSRQQLDWHAN